MSANITKNRILDFAVSLANHFCDVMGWPEIKVKLGSVEPDNTGRGKKFDVF